MKIALYILAAIMFVGIVFGMVQQNREYAARGGVLVKGQITYVCVAAAKAIP
jgi:hypothetical protein